MNLKDLECKENIDIDEYYDYFIKVKNSMEHPEWLGDLTKEDFIELISKGAKIWTYFDNGKMVCSQMYIPATRKGKG